jgi:asparagine synthase (glutamine-hydrolysing)
VSAIAGIIQQAGKPASDGVVRKMLAAMIHRSPDGTNVASAGRAVLGHGALRTLPEDEPQPFEEDDLLITADVRLDNRATLIADLGLRDQTVSDARLVLKAYRRWGAECPERLLGDFAFAIWDRGEQALFAARDFIGVKPFYYHQGGGRMVFASEIKGVLSDPSVPRRVDETRIAEFLGNLAPQSHQTLYADILRLPAAHALTFKDQAVTVRCYWRPPEGPDQPRPDAPAEFADLLKTAVKARLRSTSTPGSMLSGGLDSTAIACLASPLVKAEFGTPLPTFSAVFDQTPQWNERPFIEAALEGGGFEPTFVDGHGVSAILRLNGLLASQDGPFLGPNLDLTGEVYRAAAEKGVRVLLNGHGGDEVVSAGHGRLHELARSGRWAKLWREVKALADTAGEPALRSFLRYFEHYGSGKRLFPFARRVLRKLGAKDAPPPPHWASIVNRDLVERSGIRDIRRAALTPISQASTQRELHLASTDTAQQSYALEILDRAAAAVGIEVRHPFWDRRLLEFCLSLPSEEILDGGWSRRILRRSMEGVMPSKVQWRRDKLDFAPHVVLDMLNAHGALLEDIVVADTHDIGGYVDLAGARSALERLREKREAAEGHDVQFVWRTVAFALWLKAQRDLPQAAEIG